VDKTARTIMKRPIALTLVALAFILNAIWCCKLCWTTGLIQYVFFIGLDVSTFLILTYCAISFLGLFVGIGLLWLKRGSLGLGIFLAVLQIVLAGVLGLMLLPDRLKAVEWFGVGRFFEAFTIFILYGFIFPTCIIWVLKRRDLRELFQHKTDLPTPTI
jgi:hypothetical protein